MSVAVPFGAHKDTTEECDFQPVLPVYSTGIFLQNENNLIPNADLVIPFKVLCCQKRGCCLAVQLQLPTN